MPEYSTRMRGARLSRGVDRVLSLQLNSENFLSFEFLAFIAMKLLSDFGIFPAAAYYIFDILNIILILLSLGKVFSQRNLGRYLLFPVVALALLCFTSAIVGVVNPECAIWELLVDFRIFGVLVLICVYWDYAYWKRFINLLFRLQWVNALLAAVEFYGLGLIQDNIGGMFGIAVGCNGSLNLYLCFVCAYGISQYVSSGRDGSVSLLALSTTCICSIAIAAIAEIKFFYFELALISLLLVVFNRPTRRTFTIVAAICIAFLIGMYILSIIMPSEYALMTNIDAIMAEADNSNLSTGYGVSRIHAIAQLDAMFFHGDSLLFAFGMGFGSATPGMASGLFVSRFYSAYGILRYDYLQIPTLFLQVGMIGVAAYLVAIFSPAIQGYRDRKQFGTERKWVLSLALTFAMLFFVNCFYMATMRTQFTFLWALMLVAPYLAYGKSDSVKVGR